MKNYDDLQRFKDKTRTGAIEFKDMSAQNQQLNTSSWAIIRQLSGEREGDDAVLARAGSVSVAIPQAVKPGEFDAALAKPIPVQTADPTVAQRSILGSLAAAMPAKSVKEIAVLPDAQEKPAAASLLAQLAPSADVTVRAPEAAPVAAPAASPAWQNTPPPKAEPARFEQLFAAKGSAATSHPAKEVPLQPLLEMIASCR